MSLVERALKKLQESRAHPPEHPAAAVPPPIAAPSAPVAPAPIVHHEPRLTTVPLAPAGPIAAPAASSPPLGATNRIVAIDREALRAMELMPPAAFERQIASQYQHIKRPLVAAALGKSNTPVPNGHLIMMASALSGEGKTFTSINLALSMALERDIEVLLIDADVAKPHVSRIFGLQHEKGLLDLLDNGSLHPESLILPTSVPRLWILPAGKQVSNATELLASARMEQIVAQLGGQRGKRIVLFDSPPLLLSTESRAIVGAVGQLVMVVRAELTPQSAVADAIDLVGENKPISMILNQSESPPSSGYYGYGSYGDAESDAVGNKNPTDEKG